MLLDPLLPDDDLFFDVACTVTAIGCPSTVWYEARTSLPGWMSFALPIFPSTVTAVESLSCSFTSP